MDIRKLLASGLLVGVMTLGAACQWLSPAPTTTPWPTATTPMTSPSREELRINSIKWGSDVVVPQSANSACMVG